MERTSSPSILDLAELEAGELEAALERLGARRFHAQQIFRWVYQRGVVDFAQMTDLAKGLRADLAAAFTVSAPAVVERLRSEDSTEKLLLELGDGRRIESVFIPETPSMTFCISTQVGCAMRCD